ncbi:MAG: RNA polymerase sigma factor [Pseudobacter sp.]|uniref:RNA polymerase sigma factor n=1 Tax=Pseudobacter sp. TaxID=2045420 RepID=UPI003F80FB1F
MSANHLHNEHELLSLIAEGDEEAFARLFKSTAGHLHSYLGKIIKDRDALAEVMQETYIKVWLNRDKLKDVSYPTAYISRIAAHEAFAYLNKNAHVILVDPASQVFAGQSINDTEESITYKETYQLVQQAINELPAQRRLIYQMSRLDGLKSPEIAAKLQLSTGYVRNSLSVAQQAIRDKLAAAGKLILLVLVFFQYFFSKV